MRVSVASVCVGLAIAGVLSGLTLLVVPARAGVPKANPANPIELTQITEGDRGATVLLEYETITRSNIFARDRKSPVTRYTPEHRSETTQVATTAAPRPNRFILYGVASGPTGAVALIDADRSIPGAEIYRLGDRVGAYVLETVSETSVTLRGVTDTLVLNLELTRGRTR